MYHTFFLTFLAVTVLPAAFAEDYVQGAPTLIFQSHFSDASEPLRASVEIDRQNNIKGTRTQQIGRSLGPNPPLAGMGKLTFPAPTFSNPTNLPRPGFGGGAVMWSPFRLDHNTVWDTNAEPVEDNAWIFSWRQRFTRNPAPALSYYGGTLPTEAKDRDSSAWQVIYSFPVSKRLHNLVIAYRYRLSGASDEIGVFMGESAVKNQQLSFTSTNTNPSKPVVSWLVPRLFTGSNHASSIIVYVPMADRAAHPTIEISFVASHNDFTDKATHPEIKAWLDGVVSTAVSTACGTYWGVQTYATSPYTNFSNVDFTWPADGKVGMFTATYSIMSSGQDVFARVLLSQIASLIRQFLERPLGHPVLNPAQNITANANVVRFTSIKASTRIPGGFNANSAKLWIDGKEQVSLPPPYISPSIIVQELSVVGTFPAVTVVRPIFNPRSVMNEYFDFLSGAFSFTIDQPSAASWAQACRDKKLSNTVLASMQAAMVAPLVASNTFFTWVVPDMIDIGYTFTTTPDVYGVGGYDECWIDFVVRVRHFSEFMPANVITNNEVASMKRQFPSSDTYQLFNGPAVFVGGQPTTWSPLTGFGDFLGLLSYAELEDLKIYTTAGELQQGALAESFLKTLVECGDGELDFATEACDARDATCTTNCTCPYRTVPMAPMGCTSCGNGFLDANEACDYSVDPWCKKDCTACSDAAMVMVQGRCTYCGNGKLDIGQGEACDFAADPQCNSNCKSCKGTSVPTGTGTCTTCGNGMIDGDEVCDAANNFCSSDCRSCAPGYTSRSGFCTLCGNGVLDAGELCDTALSAGCAFPCDSCEPLNERDADGQCSRCGNGKLDAGEVCDRFYPGCSMDCQGCSADMVPALDSLGSCTMCGNGRIDPDEMCDSDEHCVDCKHCRYPYKLFPGGVCLLCGNGLLDDGEMCDAAHPECKSACQGCMDGYEPFLDMQLNPTGLCKPTECGSAPTVDGSDCVC